MVPRLRRQHTNKKLEISKLPLVTALLSPKDITSASDSPLHRLVPSFTHNLLGSFDPILRKVLSFRGSWSILTTRRKIIHSSRPINHSRSINPTSPCCQIFLPLYHKVIKEKKGKRTPCESFFGGVVLHIFRWDLFTRRESLRMAHCTTFSSVTNHQLLQDLYPSGAEKNII